MYIWSFLCLLLVKLRQMRNLPMLSTVVSTPTPFLSSSCGALATTGTTCTVVEESRENFQYDAILVTKFHKSHTVTGVVRQLKARSLVHSAASLQGTSIVVLKEKSQVTAAPRHSSNKGQDCNIGALVTTEFSCSMKTT